MSSPQAFLRKFFDRFVHHLSERIQATPNQAHTDTLLLLGKLHAARVKDLPVTTPFHEAEFKIFSQFGDDGIIQFLIQHLPTIPKTFIEFGVEDYKESNTRFLLQNNNWQGLVMDASDEYMERLKQERLYWRHNLTALTQFITKDNVNDLFRQAGFTGEIGILSVDIDGIDYWILDAISAVRPALIIAEYNSVFGSTHAISVPYDPGFIRTKAHYSNLYWGCSLGALKYATERKGYALIGSNSNGNNAYFLRKDLMAPFQEKTLKEAYVESQFRESRDGRGGKTFLNGASRLDLIKHLSVIDVTSNKPVTLSTLS